MSCKHYFKRSLRDIFHIFIVITTLVVHAIQNEPCARKFFDLFSSLYNFFHQHCVSEKYDALCFNGLLEICWTNYCDVTSCIVENKNCLLTILSEITEDDDATVDMCTEASGLLIQIKRHHFFEIGIFGSAGAWCRETSKCSSTVSVCGYVHCL